MKLEPMTTARFAFPASAMISRLSVSVRSVWTWGRLAPGTSSRTGSAPVASSSAPYATVRPSESVARRASVSIAVTSTPAAGSMRRSR
jgi:hypothetical protein